MIKFNNKALLLQQLIIESSGRTAERDFNLMDSALNGSMGYESLLEWIKAHRV